MHNQRVLLPTSTVPKRCERFQCCPSHFMSWSLHDVYNMSGMWLYAHASYCTKTHHQCQTWLLTNSTKWQEHCRFKEEYFIGYSDAGVTLVMAHFQKHKPSQGTFLFVISMPRVEHHGRSVLTSNKYKEICHMQECRNFNGIDLNKHTQQNGNGSGFYGIQDFSVH